MPSKLTVDGFFDEWMTSIKDSVKPSPYANYADYQGAYVKPTIGRRLLQRVDVPTLNALYRHLLAGGRCKSDNNTRMYEYWEARQAAGLDLTRNELVAEVDGVTIHAARKAIRRYRAGRVPVPKTPGLAPKTVKNVHRMMHRALADAVAWRYIEYNPAEHAALPRESRKGTRQRGTTWTPDELAAWLAVAVDDRDAAIWVLAATTGMRRSELAGAERQLLDLDNATLELGDTRVVVDGKTEESDGKSESGRRTISLDPLTVAYLRRHLAMLDAEHEAFGDSYHDSGKLICHPDGRPVHADTITDRFNRLVDRAGVKHIRLHDVRHTYATTSLDAGVDPKIVADRIGHANMAYIRSPSTRTSRQAKIGARPKPSPGCSWGRVSVLEVRGRLHRHCARRRGVRDLPRGRRGQQVTGPLVLYVGAHQPHWTWQAGIPLFVSHRQLARKRLYRPAALSGWARTASDTPPRGAVGY
jgi:integrase